MADEAAVTYQGRLLEQGEHVVLELGEGATLEIGAGDVLSLEQMRGVQDAPFATVRVRAGAAMRAGVRAGAARLEPEAAGPLPLIAYEQGGAAEVSILPGPLERDWMDATPNRFAYRCLPLLIANQSGWVVLNTRRFAATWDGGQGQDAIRLEHELEAPGLVNYAVSHFGSGVLTFTIPYLFRTPPGFNLHVRGPANMPKDGIAALEGIVETDWTDATFTMNWRFTRPHHRVVFEEDEPIAMLSPLRRGEAERFRPVFRAIETEPDTEAGFVAFRRSRAQFIADLADPDTAARKAGWQRHYMRGETAEGRRSREHQTGVSLARFVEEQTSEE